MGGNYKKLLEEGKILCPYVKLSLEKLDDPYFGMSYKERAKYDSIHKSKRTPMESFLKTAELVVVGSVSVIVLPIMILGFIGLFGFLLV